MDYFFRWGRKEIELMDKDFRRNLINGLSGFKGANLIGTVDKDGEENLAIFNSVVHIGADPALMGFIMRPRTVPRNTYQNICETRFFTINSVHQSFIEKAHQTSAKYPATLSEFEEVGIESYFLDDFPAPFVKESAIKVGLEFVEELPIKANGTMLMVGAVVELDLDETVVDELGYVNLDRADGVALNGLNTYYSTEKLKRLSYARINTMPEDFSANGKH